MTFKYQDFVFNDFSGGITDKYVDGAPNEAKTLDNFVLSEIGKPEVRSGFDLFLDPSNSINRVMGIYDLNGELYYSSSDLIYRIDESGQPSDERINSPKVAPAPIFQNTTVNSSYPSHDTWKNHLIVTNTGDDTVSPIQLNRPMVIYKDENDVQQSHEMGIPDYPSTPDVSPEPVFSKNDAAGTNIYFYRIHYSYTYQVDKLTFKVVGFATQYEVRTINPIDIGVDDNIISNLKKFDGTNTQHDVDSAEGLMEIEVYRTTNNGTVFFRINDGNSVPVIPVTPNTTPIANVNDSVKDSDLINRPTIYTTSGSQRNANETNALVDHSQPPKCKFLTVVNDTAYYANCIDITTGEHNPHRFYQSIPSSIQGVYELAFEDLKDKIVGISNVNGHPMVFTDTFVYRIEGVIDAFGNGTIRPRVISDTVGCKSHNSIVNTGKELFWAGDDGFYITDGYNVKNITPRLKTSYQEFTDKSLKATATITPYTFTAIKEGVIGNSIMLTFNGVDTLSTVVNAWNAANPFNTVAASGNPDGIIPPQGIALSGGGLDNRSDKIYGTYDSKEERIYWGVGDNGFENNKMWVMNLKTRGITTISASLLSLANQASFRTASLIERNGELFRGDEIGLIYRHSLTLTEDIVRDDGEVDKTKWLTSHIPFKLVTSATAFGSAAIKKWVSSATITLKSNTQVAYKPISINDDSFKTTAMTEVRQMDTGIWADVDFVWGNPDISWRVKNTISKQRRFPRNHSRCFFKQIGLEPVITTRFRSDAFDLADIVQVPLNPSEWVITLQSGKWPTNIISDSIAFEHDNYATTLTIKSRTDTTLLVVGSFIPENINSKWEIKGYNRKQRMEVKSISMKFTPLSREGNRFQQEDSGVNES